MINRKMAEGLKMFMEGVIESLDRAEAEAASTPPKTEPTAPVAAPQPVASTAAAALAPVTAKAAPGAAPGLPANPTERDYAALRVTCAGVFTDVFKAKGKDFTLGILKKYAEKVSEVADEDLPNFFNELADAAGLPF